MKAKTIKGKTPDDIHIALQQSMSEGFKPTLAFVFLSIAIDRDAISQLLDDKEIAIFGATTNGEFTGEGIIDDSAVILLSDMHPSHFTILFEEYHGTNYRETSSTIAKKALELFDHPAFLISGSDLKADAEELLHGIEDVAGMDVNVFGGMAGDNFQLFEQFVFTNKKMSTRGVLALVIDEDKVLVKGRATGGWKPIGTEKTITRSEGNRVYTIDHQPALDVVAKYSGLTNPAEQGKDIALEMAISLPLLLLREKGDPVMRPGIIINWEDHSMVCSGSMPQGSRVRFSLPPDFDVIEKVIDSTQDLKDTEMPEAEAVIVFNCAVRHLVLGPSIAREIEGVAHIWNAPLAGFFSFGELGRATKGNLEMHNMTTVCVALKEK